MNTVIQSTMRRLCAVLCVILASTCSEASARTPRARVQKGAIEMIDVDARILRIQSSRETVPLTLAWDSRTRFIYGSHFVTAAELTKGTSVTIWYHTPFFGEPFATKIEIEH